MAGRKPIREEDEPRFLAALATMPLRDQAWITLALNCGYRVREIMSLNCSHVLEGGRIKSHIRLDRRLLKAGAGPKKRAITSRCVPINPALRAILEKYLFARFGSGGPVTDEPLFPSRNHGGRISRWRANEIVREVLERAGIEDRDLYGTHSLRKTYCNRCYTASGFDIVRCMLAMGHAAVTTTQRYLVEGLDTDALIMGLGTPKPELLQTRAAL